MRDPAREDEKSVLKYSAPWLCEAKRVKGTSALSLSKQIHADMPVSLEPTSSDIAVVCEHADTVTFNLVPDKASGNVLFLRKTAKDHYEVVRPKHPNSLLLLDTCTQHSHNRGKRSVKPMRKHILKHYSIGHVVRSDTTLKTRKRLIKLGVSRRLKRNLGPPPGGGTTLRDVVDHIFKPHKEYHVRKNGKPSEHMKRLNVACDFFNAPLKQPDNGIGHYCRSVRGVPCCASLAPRFA